MVTTPHSGWFTPSFFYEGIALCVTSTRPQYYVQPLFLRYYIRLTDKPDTSGHIDNNIVGIMQTFERFSDYRYR